MLLTFVGNRDVFLPWQEIAIYPIYAYRYPLCLRLFLYAEYTSSTAHRTLHRNYLSIKY